MSIFPTRILVATDGSEEANLALQTASDLAKYTGSDLHFVYVKAASYVSPTTDWDSFGGEYLPNRLNEATMAAAESQVDRQVQRVMEGGGEIAGAHARVGFPDAEIVDLAEELGAGLISDGKPRTWGREESADGRRLGLGGPPRPLPGYGGATLETRDAEGNRLCVAARDWWTAALAPHPVSDAEGCH